MNKIFGISKLICRFSKLKNPLLSQVLNPTSAVYLEFQYQNWLKNPESVSASLSAFFSGVKQGFSDQQLWTQPSGSVVSGQFVQTKKNADLIKVKLLVDHYRSYGHLIAKVDPLQLDPTVRQHGIPQHETSLSLQKFGLSQSDLELQFSTSWIGQSMPKEKMKLRDIIKHMEHIYCEQVSFQYMHIESKEQRDFIISKIQHIQNFTPTKALQLSTYEKVCKDWAFSSFLEDKFNNSKRFGIQGCQSVVTGLQALKQCAPKLGVQTIVMGMAHRGRLSTLYNFFGKPARNIFAEFLDKKQTNLEDQTGDVKYHLGVIINQQVQGKRLNLTMLANPSHLEAVNPLVYGRARAYQESLPGEKSKNKVLPIVIHGDAAISGQGIVYQSIQLHDLHDYSVGGVIHIVVNNQIGFTTTPSQSRSTSYCTQIAKVVGAPILHINGDRPQLVSRCLQFALQYRQKFNKDIIIDIIGFRKFGHNQQDQPAFTQPLMYSKIRTKKNVWQLYTQNLIKNGVITKEQSVETLQKYVNQLKKEYQFVQSGNKIQKWGNAQFQFLHETKKWGKLQLTGVDNKDLQRILTTVTQIPQGFKIHPTIKKIFQEKRLAFAKNQGLDWATMESLAFGTLLDQGFSVRLSGQDVQRGTFSHRHAVLSDQSTDTQKLLLLKKISNNIRVCNSLLSQFGVMGFQYGYSITNPNTLILWQAQFGDFANTAQIMIDNFIISGQAKWRQTSGLCLLLPHGMDGQGPQHSSARIQRFLQLSNDDPEKFISLSPQQRMKKINIQVVYCSQSGNYFHVLRRQLRRSFRKPLIVFNSKKLLRFKKANSKLQSIKEGTQFRPVIDTYTGDPSKIKKLIFCSGQFYYDMEQAVVNSSRNDIAFVKIQQLAPFPYEEINKALQKYANSVQIAWAQQQHQNQGAYLYSRRRIQFLLEKGSHSVRRMRYYGRNSSSASACGSNKLHKQQQSAIMKRLLN